MSDTAPANPILHATHLHKTYRMGGEDLHVLRGIDLTVTPGEWLAIVGASGSGKSTLLHLLGGLDRPDPGQGDIAFKSESLFTSPKSNLDRYRNRDVGFVFQQYHLLPELSAIENVTLVGMIGKDTPFKNKRERADHAEKLLTHLGLAQRLSHRPNKLSGGERQRVAIARALMNSPSLLLADEPTGNLDAETGEQIVTIFRELHAQGQTILMVTHDPKVAAAADHQLTLDRGQIATD